MYVIRDKKTKDVLHIHAAPPGEEAKPEEFFPGYDPKRMEVGRSDEPAIPAWFEIVKGKVVPVEPPEAQAAPAPRSEATPAEPSLDELKETLISALSEQSFAQRRELIPDHELQNAALGVYDEERSEAIRETVAAFRDEFHRLRSQVEKARSKKALEKIEPKFPEKLIGAPKKPSRGRGG